MKHVIIGILMAFIAIGCGELPAEGPCCQEEYTALAYATGHDCYKYNEQYGEWEIYDLPAMNPRQVTGVSKHVAVEKAWGVADRLVQSMSSETGLECDGGYSYGVLYDGYDVDGSPKSYHPQPPYELLD